MDQMTPSLKQRTPDLSDLGGSFRWMWPPEFDKFTLPTIKVSDYETAVFRHLNKCNFAVIVLAYEAMLG